ncbi:MAG: pyrroline-5-carboxylate reductase [Betaproteobacteria bacterium]
MRLVFVGGGNMGCALVGGLLAQGQFPDTLTVIETDAAAQARLHGEFGVSVASALSADVAAKADAMVLAVKPQHLRGAALSLAPFLTAQLIVSIAAGVRIADLSRWLGGYVRVVRAMPNTPALLRLGIAGLFAHPAVTARERERAEEIMNAVGQSLWCEREQQLDAVTAVSGSGPAYIFYVLEAMITAAETLGFTAAQARQLAYSTAAGATALAAQSSDPATVLRAQVTSKGGTTEAAVAVLDQYAVKAAFMAAIRAADARAAELGDQLGKDS